MSLQVELLPITSEDAVVLEQPDPGGFNDFNPMPGTGAERPASLDDDGAFAIWADDELVGSVSHRAVYWGPNEGSKSMMLGIQLVADARGRGIGTAALRIHVSMLFSYTTIFRLEAHTDVANVATQKMLGNLGFVQEGVTRQAQWRHGARHDGYLYSLLRPEWSNNRK